MSQQKSSMYQHELRLIAAVLLTALVAIANTATAPAAARRPNVLLIVSDDQRPDTIAALGNRNLATPNLDRLVRSGAAFTRAVCPNPICVPSRAEMITGCSSLTNGAMDSGAKLSPLLVPWATAMRRGGYRTCYVGKWHTSGRPTDHGYDESLGLFASGGAAWAKEQVDWKGRPVTGYKGWIFQNDQGEKFPEHGVGLTANISARLADAAIELIERPSDRPFFLHVNFTAPHDPLLVPPSYAGKYRPADMTLPPNFLPQHPFDHGNFRGRDELLFAFPRTPLEVREELAVYYAVISHLDEQIGRMLAALDKSGQADNTLVVFTADHGLAIGSHGLRGKQNMYDHTIGVPLVLRGPGIPQGRQFAAQVYLRDLYPTVCELSGVGVPETVESKSFAPVLAGKQAAIHSQTLAYFRDSQRMIRTDRWKLIYYPVVARYQLFDLHDDPQEVTDLSAVADHAPRLTELKAILQAAQRAARDPLAPAP